METVGLRLYISSSAKDGHRPNLDLTELADQVCELRPQVCVRIVYTACVVQYRFGELRQNPSGT